MRKALIASLAVSTLLAAVGDAQVPRTKAPEGASVYFVAPKNGDTVARKFVVQFGLKGMGVAPATINHPSTGHHHLLIDVSEMPNLAMPLPATDAIRHFGGGQTEVELTLPPGKHTLQLVLGDYLHIPHEKPIVSEKITVNVK
jgi:hypothetical protein